jgi:hypothetical protein
MHVFLSHNQKDKDYATPLAAQLRLLGTSVWLDDWEIRPGDSVPGKVNDALAVVDTVVVLWSHHAAASRWVDDELSAALARHLHDGSVRVIPVRLDDTELPPLLGHRKWLRVAGIDELLGTARQIAGLASEEDFLRAVQATIDEAKIEFRYFPGCGILVGCPDCGAPADTLERWNQFDERANLYVGVRCTKCGWSDGGEL